MQRLLIFLGFLVISVLPGIAHLTSGLTDYLPRAEIICLAKVTSIDGRKVTFFIGEIVRGKNAPSITLTDMQWNFTVNSEWLLVSCPTGYHNGSVGWALKGDCDWIPAPVERMDEVVYVKMRGAPSLGIVWDKLPDGSQGLTLDHLKQFLAKPSAQSDARPAKG